MLNSKSSHCLLLSENTTVKARTETGGHTGPRKKGLVKVQKGFSGVKSKRATVAERPSHPCVLLV